MTTKEQERKALAQVKKIVDSLGEQSYLGTAFDGCFQDAETNIECDFAFSMKSRWESAEEKVEKLQKELAEAKELNGLLVKRAERAEANAMSNELAATIYNDYRQALERANSELKQKSIEMYEMVGTVPADDKGFVRVVDIVAGLKRKIARLEKTMTEVQAHLK